MEGGNPTQKIQHEAGKFNHIPIQPHHPKPNSPGILKRAKNYKTRFSEKEVEFFILFCADGYAGVNWRWNCSNL
jgi:hypothetical protein